MSVTFSSIDPMVASQFNQSSSIQQPTLLDDLMPSAAPKFPAGTSERLPVAQVLLDSAVPHLDRPFDYAVPQDLDAKVVAGGRVKVTFSGRQMTGWVLSRSNTPSTTARLSLINKVVSAIPVLTEATHQLAADVAARYAGVTSDVLRAAIPQRVARVEAEFAQTTVPEPAKPVDPALPRTVELPMKSYGPQGWVVRIVEVVAQTVNSGGDAVVVVPDHRDTEPVAAALIEALGEEAVAQLSADMGPTPRYRSYMRLRFGQARVAVGTRSAVFAPVPNLRLLVLLDDDDASFVQPRAPYHHARDVALLRTVQTGAQLLLLSTHRSLETQRLIERGWAADHAPDRRARRAAAPHMVSTADSYQQEHDPHAQSARLPAAAFGAARQGLQTGPVLIQVGRSGFVPAVFCSQCSARQQCPHCHGPLSLPAHHHQSGALMCRWCGLHHRQHSCAECGSVRFRAGVRGADRTAQELGRAFPNVPVVSSTAEHPVHQVGDAPVLVVATPGVEPVASGGYTTGLLLDGDAQLAGEGLDVPRRVLARWFRAASLVRSAAEGGTVVVTAADAELTGALVRWDPVGYAREELFRRLELGLPPAQRMLSVTGSPQQAREMVDQAQLPQGLQWVGPATMEDQHRWLLFFSYGQAAEVVAEMRRLRRSSSAAPSRGNQAQHRAVRIAVDDLSALQV